MLSFDNVTKDFHLDEENTITPVRSVSLEIEPGEFIVIIGRSGTGKTTLLNLAAGLVRPTSGRVMVDDVDLAEMSDKQLSSLRGSKMGFVFQFPSLLPSLTVKDNVNLPAIFANGNGRGAAERGANLLDTLGLAAKMDVYPRQLSAGEQKRVVIARSLINQPQLILADEPTSDLDSQTEKEVMTILLDINSRGVTFIIVTHNLGLISFATRAFEMENGSLNQV
ncbi:MAG: ABC transporter ATP-binding protein [Chloroflexi bacterium]|nr:ABC transporter ATP-binding protein [Chloroflexota bacterium]